MSHVQRLFALVPLCSLLCIASAGAQPSIPAGFEDAHVASVPLPTAITATPDGRLLITSQMGQLYAIVDGDLQGPIFDLGEKTCAYRERGLSSVAVDPGFATNRRIYLAYAFNKFGNCEAEMSETPVGRVSRFTMNADGTVDPGSEQILIDDIPSMIGVHNQGDLKFGRDGNLYVSVGDGGCDYAFDSACFDSNDAARSLNTLVGKILRITPDGDIPADNPFTGADSARCNTSGGTTARVCQEIFATGLRNPWRMAFDPNAAGTRFFINDVGQDTWEEINEGIAAADYGWNRREGFCANGSTIDCSPAAPSGLTNPLFAYGRDEGCTSITGGAFVPAGFWPAEFDGVYLFSDYVCGAIFTLTRAADGTQMRGTFMSGLGESSATDLYFAPYNDGIALYYATYGGGGEIRRIAFAGTGNRAPAARLTATPAFGASPLLVDFDASASTDPDGDQLSVTWDFGDGSTQSDAAAVSHTYASVGTYTARVRVTDVAGESSEATLRIDVGNGPPQPTITTPSPDLRFAVGDDIVLTGSAVDPEDGNLPSSALTWRVILHHNTHTHGFLPVTSGNGIVFRAPGPENVDAALTSYLEVELTATDTNGLSATVRQALLPRTVQIQFLADPAGTRLRIDQADVATPVTFTSWVNASINVEATAQTAADGSALSFVSWSDGGAATHGIVTPQGDASYTANFARGSSTSVSVPGRIEAEDFGTGGSGLSFVDTTLANKGGAYRPSAVDIEATADAGGGFNVGWTEAGEWLAYPVQVRDAGSYNLEFRVASPGAGGLFHLEINGADVTGALRLPDTGDWQTWTTIAVTTQLEAGPQVWRLVMDQNGPIGVVGNFNWIGATQAALTGGSTPFGGVAATLPGKLEAEDFDLGAPGVAYQDLSAGNSGGTYRSGDVDVESTFDEDGGYNLGWVSPGEWLQYTVDVNAGIYDLEFRVASPGAGGTFHLEVNGTNVTGALVVPSTGDWQVWTTVKRAGVALPGGRQLWRLVIDGVGDSGNVGNFNYIRVLAGDGTVTPPPPAAAQEIVINAADIAVANIHGNWASAVDPTAASGVSLASTDLGAPTLASPADAPADYVDVFFTAQAGVRYRLWMRLKAAGDSKYNDSVWVQFSGAADSIGAPRYRLGTGQALNVNQATCADCPPTGWGWQNRAYWESDTGEVWFSASGPQMLRIQIREDGVSFDQIVLSPAQFLDTAPGPPINDQRIVSKQ